MGLELVKIQTQSLKCQLDLKLQISQMLWLYTKPIKSESLRVGVHCLRCLSSPGDSYIQPMLRRWEVQGPIASVPPETLLTCRITVCSFSVFPGQVIHLNVHISEALQKVLLKLQLLNNPLESLWKHGFLGPHSRVLDSLCLECSWAIYNSNKFTGAATAAGTWTTVCKLAS